MSFVIPHTGLSYDPKMTDWEFLLPLEVLDEALAPSSQATSTNTHNDTPSASSPGSPPPTISGFIALIKVFLCVADLLDVVFPGPPAQYSLSPGPHALQNLLPKQGRPLQNPPQHNAHSEMTLLDSLLQVMTRLNAVLNDLPDELRPIRDADDSRRALRSNVPSHFEIMRANIHITSIYIQSMVIEMCLSKVQGLPSNSNAEARSTVHSSCSTDTGGATNLNSIDALQDLLSTPSTEHTSASPAAASGIGTRLWQLKESIARELLGAVTSSPTWVLESNGSSMVRMGY